MAFGNVPLKHPRYRCHANEDEFGAQVFMQVRKVWLKFIEYEIALGNACFYFHKKDVARLKEISPNRWNLAEQGFLFFMRYGRSETPLTASSLSLRYKQGRGFDKVIKARF